MKTIIARYPGTCCECGGNILRGDTIDFLGQRQARHTACRSVDSDQDQDEDSAAGLEPGTLANDRRLARQGGLTVIRLSSGHVMTQNSRGRCEDAPCCGCCS